MSIQNLIKAFIFKIFKNNQLNKFYFKNLKKLTIEIKNCFFFTYYKEALHYNSANLLLSLCLSLV